MLSREIFNIRMGKKKTKRIYTHTHTRGRFLMIDRKKVEQSRVKNRLN